VLPATRQRLAEVLPNETAETAEIIKTKLALISLCYKSRRYKAAKINRWLM